MVHTTRSKRLPLVLLSTMLLLFLFISSACACIVEPGVDLLINNQTDQTLEIYIEGDRTILPKALPGETTKISTMLINPIDIYPDDHKFLIEAKTEEGEVVYSEEFTWQELDDMDWTIVIPPPATS